jgi:hypothetical protein
MLWVLPQCRMAQAVDVSARIEEIAQAVAEQMSAQYSQPHGATRKNRQA